MYRQNINRIPNGPSIDLFTHITSLCLNQEIQLPQIPNDPFRGLITLLLSTSACNARSKGIA